MRTDDGTARESFRKSKEWTHNATTGESSADTDARMIIGDEIAKGNMEVHSLSGKERNHLFINQEAGKSFSNLSAISGLDSVADGRGFACLDYDGDGFQDVAVVNANSPLVLLYHNDIPEISPEKNGMIALRFVGGNKTPTQSNLSNRDGYGAAVEVTLEDGVTIRREHLCGTGFATQNSSTMIIGIGQNSKVATVSIRWPSGKTTTTNDIPEGTLLTAFENHETKAFTQKTYRNPRKATPPVSRRFKLPVAKPTPGKIQVYTTTATWCAACIGHLPSLKYLQTDDIALFGVPTDPNDTPAMLRKYVAEKNPPYQMLADLSSTEKETLSNFLAKSMRIQNPILPSTIITDEEGNVLEIMKGIPNLSQVRRWKYERK